MDDKDMNKNKDLTLEDLTIALLTILHLTRRYQTNRNAIVDPAPFKKTCENWISANSVFVSMISEIAVVADECNKQGVALPVFMEKILDILFEDIENHAQNIS